MDRILNLLNRVRKNRYWMGLIVLGALAALTAIEYGLGAAFPWLWAGLLLVAAVKAAVVLVEYMHVGLLFAGDEEEHE